MVKELVRSYINIEPNENVNPDEVVGVGAAIQAGILQGQVKDILLLDVTPLSLGIETTGGLMKKLIPRNTTIPVRRSDVFSTSENNQTMVEIHILQGEREMAPGNKSLGKFRLTGIPPAPRGMPQVQVAFDIDANGILQVTAIDKTTGRQQSVIIQGSSTMTETEINRLITEASQFANEDRERKERIEKRNRAKTLADQAQRKLKEVALDYGTQFAGYYRRRIDGLCQDIVDSLEKGDEMRLDRTQADLQDALYELNREIRLQYDSEEDEGFFASLRRTFIGDDEEDDRYYSSRDYNRDDYRSSSRSPQENRSQPPSRDYRRDYPSRGYQDEPKSRDYPPRGYQDEPKSRDYPPRGYQDEPKSRDYPPRGYQQDDYQSRRPPDSSPQRNNYPPETNSSYNKKRGRGANTPYENDWDEDDDEWF
jgi:molecular chaperone DnaK